MCGRMTMTLDIEAVAERLGVDLDPEVREAYKPRYNLPPTDPHIIVPSTKQVFALRWGMGPDKPQINARAESVHKLGIFKRAFHERRCLVPADGFYEWTGAKASRRPIWFHGRPGELLFFAGIYDSRGFAVITTPANADVAATHDRMPAILVGDMAERWLREAETGLLVPAPVGFLIATPVSSRVNSVAHDDPACLEPPAQDGQLDLL